MVSIFADKSSIISRKMLMNPGHRWVIHDFVKAADEMNGLGQGRVQRVLNEMERLGYIEREKRGAMSKAILTNSEKLIKDWLRAYEFERNEMRSFYSSSKNIQKELRIYFAEKNIRYALTLHSAANLYTSFFKTSDVYFYLGTEDIEKDTLDMRQKLGLKQLVQGGNVHVIRPYYKHSAFFDTHTVKGYTVVSNLQLYLDLYNFQPRGREHAEYLKKLLEEKGKNLG